jgi:hypothetical protein
VVALTPAPGALERLGKAGRGHRDPVEAIDQGFDDLGVEVCVSFP